LLIIIYQKNKKYLVALLKNGKAGKFYLMKKLEKNLFNVFNMQLNKNNIMVTNYLMIQLVTLQDMRGFLNVNFQNGILNIYQRILIETKMETINITANSEAQRKLIDDLINVDFVEIKPAQLPATNNDIEDELPFNDNTNNSI
jgi:hypothetical protein